MLIDARQLQEGSTVSTDVCVIGSGAAGTTVAEELRRAGRDVVVLEGGGLRYERTAQDTYRGVLDAGAEHDPLDLVRQKRLGGTTTQWGGRCVPLDDIDFERRAYVEHSGWPIGLDDLLPAYRRANDYCRAGAFEYHAREALPGTGPLVLDGEGSDRITDTKLWRWSPPVDFGRAYRRVFADSPALRLLYHANVTRLVPEQGRAVVATAAGRHVTVEARTFVVAAGGLETARLLLASGVGDPDLVGRYYMIHPVAEVGSVRFLTEVPAHARGYERTRDGVWSRRMIGITPATQRELGLRNTAFAFWFPDPQDPAHGDPLLSAFSLVRTVMARTGADWKSQGVHRRYGTNARLGAHLANIAGGLPELGRFGRQWVTDRWLAERKVPSFMTAGAGPLRLRFDAEQSPERQNRVELTRQADAFGVPRLAVHHRVSATDRDSITRAFGVVADELQRLGVAKVETPPEGLGIDSLPLGDGTHQMGLARMAGSPRSGVVDRDCRVYGAPNVYVAGSAVFPTSGFAGPTLTIVALALRVADAIRR
jgi:choline dehydrogenase-like flavoprotein